jgi:hypothetical protein
MTTTIQAKMLEIATPIVKFWFTDVTVHDFLTVECMEVGEVRVWSLRQTGSWLLKLCQSVNDNKPFSLLATQLVKTPNLFNDGEENLFLLRKTTNNDGEITPISLSDLQHLLLN